jgi:ubiquinone/menaquinone biosynthesis C-methylase UbiE
MDYDNTDMPRGYDSGRSYSPEQLGRWVELVSNSVQRISIERVLDLGCGTGRYSTALANRLEAHVIGLEPSAKMLAEAKKKSSTYVALVRGSGEALPLASESIDMVFMSMVFHHFKGAGAAVRECRRVLRTGKFVCLRAGTIEQIDRYAYVPFFPEARPLLRQSLDSRAALESTFEAAGFELDCYELVQSEAAGSWSEYAERLGHRADSILVQLSDSEFERGLQALRSHAQNVPRGGVVEPVDFLVFRAV